MPQGVAEAAEEPDALAPPAEDGGSATVGHPVVATSVASAAPSVASAELPDCTDFVTLQLPEGSAQEDAETLKEYVVVQDPKLVLIPNFVSAAEVHHLLDLAYAQSAWVPSVVWRGGNPTSRKSDSCMLQSSQTPVVEAIERRAAQIAGVPVEQVERLNIVRYTPGQYFDAHHDGRNRPSTVFVYLNDVEEGGETRFTKIGYQVKPRKGCAAFWNNLDANGDMDWRLTHQGMPPASGIKYGMNCFICKTPRGALSEWPGHENTGHVMDEWWSRTSLGVREIRELNIRRLAERQLSPDEFAAATGEAACDMVERALNLIEVCKQPWFAVIPAFLEPDEIESILAGCPMEGCDGWERAHASADRGTSEFFRVESDRTIEERLADVLEVDVNLVERIVVERHLPGQYVFERHSGPERRFTALVYMSDVGSCEDGMTDFKHCSFQFRPMQGAALLWRNWTPNGQFDKRLKQTEMPLAGVTRYHLLCHVRVADAGGAITSDGAA